MSSFYISPQQIAADDASAQQAADARVTELEHALTQVQRQLVELGSRMDLISRGTGGALAGPAPAAPSTADPAAGPHPGTWALEHLRRAVPAPGAVITAASAEVGQGHVELQHETPVKELLREDWSERAEPLTGLASTTRLEILRLLVDGERTVPQLVDELSLPSAETAYHHLRQLQGTGWATSPQRGRWTIPAERVIPLLAIVAVLEDA